MKRLYTTEEIIKALENRDPTALEEIGKSYGALLIRIALNLGLNPSDAEECMNDTYLNVWNTIPPEKPDSIRSYLCMLMTWRSSTEHLPRQDDKKKRPSNGWSFLLVGQQGLEPRTDRL